MCMSGMRAWRVFYSCLCIRNKQEQDFNTNTKTIYLNRHSIPTCTVPSPIHMANTDQLLLFIIFLLAFLLAVYMSRPMSPSSLLVREGMTNRAGSRARDIDSAHSFTGSVTVESEDGSVSGTLTMLENGTATLVVTDNTNTQITFNANKAGDTVLFGPAGATATLYYDNIGPNRVVISYSNGRTVVLTTGEMQNTYGVSTEFDNYNHFDGTAYANIFYGPNGRVARIENGPNGKTVVITNTDGNKYVYRVDATDANVYIGPNGGRATVVTEGKRQRVRVKMPNGDTFTFYDTNRYAKSYDTTINQFDEVTSGVHYGQGYKDAFVPSSGTLTTISGPNGNTYASYDSTGYYNSLPRGIPRSQIPAGKEDLYILKSEVVPPVCPKCPAPVVSKEPDVSKCPPCPACARCPEPSFECKKVPNYNAFASTGSVPMPVVSSFASFGM